MASNLDFYKHNRHSRNLHGKMYPNVRYGAFLILETHRDFISGGRQHYDLNSHLYDPHLLSHDPNSLSYDPKIEKLLSIINYYISEPHANLDSFEYLIDNLKTVKALYKELITNKAKLENYFTPKALRWTMDKIFIIISTFAIDHQRVNKIQFEIIDNYFDEPFPLIRVGILSEADSEYLSNFSVNVIPNIILDNEDNELSREIVFVIDPFE